MVLQTDRLATSSSAVYTSSFQNVLADGKRTSCQGEEQLTPSVMPRWQTNRPKILRLRVTIAAKSSGKTVGP
jgi:hypothetical protein